MTDHKPLSDEELDELEHAWWISSATAARLIAQSREANQLREENALLKQQAANVLILQPDEMRDMCELIVRYQEDPAARAKRELGEWLAAAPKRYFSEFAPELMAPIGAPRRYNWTIKLTEHWTDMGIGDDPDRTMALMAALKAAKEAGR